MRPARIYKFNFTYRHIFKHQQMINDHETANEKGETTCECDGMDTHEYGDTTTITAGKPKSTKEIEDQGDIKSSERIHLQGPTGMFPHRPKPGDTVTFVYEYQACGWRQTRVEVVG